MDITELLERAVADVAPSERRPTDAVLRLAESRALGSRIRKALAGLVGVAVIGGGAVVVATGSDDTDRETAPPRPLTLQVDLPTGWSEVTRPTAVDCTSTIEPLTVYRDVALGDLGSCRPGQAISVTGPSLLIGQLPADVAETIRVAGAPVEAGGAPGWAVTFDAPFSYVVWLPAGSSDDLAYAAVAPSSRGEGEEPYRDLVGGGTTRLPAELVDLVSAVRARGDLATDAVLPATVSTVQLRQEPVNVSPAPGAWVSDRAAVAAVLDAMAPARDGAPACGAAASVRTMHLQDAGSHRWVRVDLLDDGSGCRTIRSELGGSRQVSGDPVAVAVAADEPPAAVVRGTERAEAGDLSVAVPSGWATVSAASVDPCRLAGPSVVVSDELAPSCWAVQYGRPTQPFVWVTTSDVDALRTLDQGRVQPKDGELVWRLADLDLGDLMITGLAGSVPGRPGGIVIVGLTEDASADLRASAAS